MPEKARLAYVQGLGVVEVLGRAVDDHVTVRVRGKEDEHRVPLTMLAAVNCEAAKKARVEQLRAAHERRRL
jgi:hypothetical protein